MSKKLQSQNSKRKSKTNDEKNNNKHSLDEKNNEKLSTYIKDLDTNKKSKDICKVESEKETIYGTNVQNKSENFNTKAKLSVGTIKSRSPVQISSNRKSLSKESEEENENIQSNSKDNEIKQIKTKLATIQPLPSIKSPFNLSNSSIKNSFDKNNCANSFNSFNFLNDFESPDFNFINEIQINKKQQEPSYEKGHAIFHLKDNQIQKENEYLGKKTLSKRGRKKNKVSKKVHTCEDKDNLRRKIQVHFLNNLVEFCNQIVVYFTKEKDNLFLKLKNLSYIVKKEVSNESRYKLQSLKIKEILVLESLKDANPQDNSFNKNFNTTVLKDAFKKSKDIETIFNLDFSYIYNEVYLKKNREFVYKNYNIKLNNSFKNLDDLCAESLKYGNNYVNLLRMIAENRYNKKDINYLVVEIPKSLAHPENQIFEDGFQNDLDDLDIFEEDEQEEQEEDEDKKDKTEKFK